MSAVLIRSLVALVLLGRAAAAPRPGDVYREFYVVMGGAKDWRITDATSPKAPMLLLPNSLLRVTVADLKGATRAEVQLDRWGGHSGTTGKSIRLNGQPWIPVPELTTTPAGMQPYCFMTEDNPTIEVPLAHLREGENTLEGFTSGQDARCGNNWGQWGWYGAIVRVYYGAGKSHPEGRITSHAPGAMLTENPVIEVSARGAARVDRVDVLAFYDGFDEDGDGNFEDWHHAYRAAELTGHAGTATTAPYKIRWDTGWVPDSKPGAVKLMGRIRDSAGVWSVTPVVDRLTLKRDGASVKLYKPRDVPARYWVRAGKKLASKVDLPAADPLDKATDAVVALRTWNGNRQEFHLNDYSGQVDGADHAYAQGLRQVPASALRAGENTIWFQTESKEHGLEVLWPGPAVLVRYGKPAPPAAESSDWLNPDYRLRIPVDLTSSVPLRTGKPVEIELNFTEAMKQAGVSGAFDEKSIRVVDYDQRGIKDAAVSWQFERAKDYDARRKAAGTLIVLARPVMPKMTRRLMVYFATEGASAPQVLAPADVRVTDNVEHAGQSSLRISTPAGDYIYHKEGAGFASLLDRAGNDWISFHPGDRAAGEFRGIPNLGPYFHPGYTGAHGSRTTVEVAGPIKARIRSESNDGRFAAVWEFYPAYVRMTLLRADQPYWFLYEGTPGGKLDVDSDFWVASDGTKRPVSERWNGNLPAPEWAYFGDAKLKRVLFLANHQNDAITDEFWQMESNMTVFGFGRKLKSTEKFLTSAPAQFTIGFAETTDFAADINSAINAPKVTVGRAEARPSAR